jgi:hypothetical protein
MTAMAHAMLVMWSMLQSTIGHLLLACFDTDVVITPTWQKTQLPKAKKARSQTERVEGVALTKHWRPGETVIPSDEQWKLMGPEWLEKLKKAKHQDDLFSGIQTKGHTLKYQMHLSPTEGQTMWVLRHCSDSFDALMRKRK